MLTRLHAGICSPLHLIMYPERTLKEMRLRLPTKAQNSWPHADDASLMARIASGDEAALSEAYDRYSRPVFSLLLRILQDKTVAEEVLQDVFFFLWQNASRFSPERGALQSWLLVMARNRAISYLRRRPRYETLDELTEPWAASGQKLQDTAAEQGEIVARVRSALAQLPDEQNKLFELAYFSGLSHSEIAAQTGQPLGTVKTRLRTALTSVRRAFE
jgi:RNA polymerase sigma-70 factor (ECF subfamily)